MWRSGKGMRSRRRSAWLLAPALCWLWFCPAVTMAQSTPSENTDIEQRLNALDEILTALSAEGMSLQTLSAAWAVKSIAFEKRIDALTKSIESERQRHNATVEQHLNTISELETQVAELRTSLEQAKMSSTDFVQLSSDQISQYKAERDREKARADAAVFIARLGPVIAGVVGFVAGLLIGLNVQ